MSQSLARFQSAIFHDSPAEYCAAHLKHRKYDADFVGTNYDFSALLFESTGAVNREGREFLAQLFRFAARYSGSHLSVLLVVLGLDCLVLFNLLLLNL